VGFRRNTLRVVSLRAFVFLLFRHGLLLLRVVSCSCSGIDLWLFCTCYRPPAGRGGAGVRGAGATQNGARAEKQLAPTPPPPRGSRAGDAPQTPGGPTG
jgi:hypothetical protein